MFKLHTLDFRLHGMHSQSQHLWLSEFNLWLRFYFSLNFFLFIVLGLLTNFLMFVDLCRWNYIFAVLGKRRKRKKKNKKKKREKNVCLLLFQIHIGVGIFKRFLHSILCVSNFSSFEIVRFSSFVIRISFAIASNPKNCCVYWCILSILTRHLMKIISWFVFDIFSS